MTTSIMQPVNPERRPSPSRRHREVFDYLCDCWLSGQPACLNDVARYFGVHAQTAQFATGQLERKGWITRRRDRQDGRKMLLLPATYQVDGCDA